MMDNSDVVGFGRSLSEQGRSSETIKKYQRNLSEFFMFADKFDEQNIYKFKDYLSKRYSTITVKFYLSVLSQFCKYKGIDIDFRNFTVYYAEKEEEKTSKDNKYKLPPMKRIGTRKMSGRKAAFAEGKSSDIMNQWLEKVKDSYDVGDRIRCLTLETGVLTEGTIIYKSDYFISAELKVGYRTSFVWHDVAMGKIKRIS